MDLFCAAIPQFIEIPGISTDLLHPLKFPLPSVSIPTLFRDLGQSRKNFTRMGNLTRNAPKLA